MDHDLYHTVMHAGLGTVALAILSYGGSVGGFTCAGIIFFAQQLPPTYATPATAAAAIIAVCSLLSALYPVWQRNEDAKRKFILDQQHIANDARVRELQRHVEELSRHTKANTIVGTANAAKTAALGGAMDGLVRRQQDSGTLPIPGPANDIPIEQWPRVLLVEDDPQQARNVGQLLAYAYFRATPAATVAEALAMLKAEQFALAVIDLHLPDGDGLAVLEALREAAAPARVVVTTGWGDDVTRDRMAKLRPDAILTKPYDPDDLIAALKG